MIPCIRFDSLHNHEYSPYNKNGKQDKKCSAKPIHRSMERIYEHVDKHSDDK